VFEAQFDSIQEVYLSFEGIYLPLMYSGLLQYAFADVQQGPGTPQHTVQGGAA